jgi:hypothetical protein
VWLSQVHYYAAAVTSGAGRSEGQVNGKRLVAVQTLVTV